MDSARSLARTKICSQQWCVREELLYIYLFSMSKLIFFKIIEIFVIYIVAGLLASYFGKYFHYVNPTHTTGCLTKSFAITLLKLKMATKALNCQITVQMKCKFLILLSSFLFWVRFFEAFQLLQLLLMYFQSWDRFWN